MQVNRDCEDYGNLFAKCRDASISCLCCTANCSKPNSATWYHGFCAKEHKKHSSLVTADSEKHRLLREIIRWPCCMPHICHLKGIILAVFQSLKNKTRIRDRVLSNSCRSICLMLLVEQRWPNTSHLHSRHAPSTFTFGNEVCSFFVRRRSHQAFAIRMEAMLKSVASLRSPDGSGRVVLQHHGHVARGPNRHFLPTSSQLPC